MYRFYVSCAVCMALATTAQAKNFNFDRLDPAIAANSALTATVAVQGRQGNAGHGIPDESIAAAGFAGASQNNSSGNCCRQDRSCCRNLWDSYCDDLPSCDRGNRCRGLGGIFSCQPAITPTCCGPTLPTLRLPKLRMPSICLPTLPSWGRPVFSRSLCRAEASCLSDCNSGAGCADANSGCTGPNSDPGQEWSEPSQAEQPTAAPPPAPLAVEESTADDWSTNPADEESFEATTPRDTTPAAAPQAEPEDSNDLLESEDDLLESAQHRSILRSLQGRLK